MVLSDLVVCYLFFGGTGAGLCLVLAVLGLLSPRVCIAVPAVSRRGAMCQMLRVPGCYRALFVPGFLTCLVLVALGTACLLVDVGDANRIMLLFMQPQLSYLTVGAWSLAACFATAALLCCAWSGLRSWRFAGVRALEVLAGVLSIVVMVYTGLLLQSLGAVPLWATPWLPALFVASSLSCGLACALAVAQLSGAARTFGRVFRRLAACDAGIIVVEAAVAAAFVATTASFGAPSATSTQAAAAASIRDLVEGSHAWLFWGGFVLAGLVLPLVLDVFIAAGRRALPGTALFASGCVLAGGLVMRFCIVGAGMHPSLVFGSVL